MRSEKSGIINDKLYRTITGIFQVSRSKENKNDDVLCGNTHYSWSHKYRYELSLDTNL